MPTVGVAIHQTVQHVESVVINVHTKSETMPVVVLALCDRMAGGKWK